MVWALTFGVMVCIARNSGDAAVVGGRQQGLGATIYALGPEVWGLGFAVWGVGFMELSGS